MSTAGEDDVRVHADDEDAAAAARARYRVEPMTPVQADGAIAPALCPGESVFAIRRNVLLERRHTRPGTIGPGLSGDLYVTSRRLIFLGRSTLTFGLDEVDEAVISGNRVLLVLREGAGIALDVKRPQLLRVEIATARAAARGQGPSPGR